MTRLSLEHISEVMAGCVRGESRHLRLAHKLLRDIIAGIQERRQHLVRKYAKYDISERDLMKIQRADPTGDRGDYLEWLILQMLGPGTLNPWSSSDILNKFHYLLFHFDKIKKSPDLLKTFQASPDINKYNLESLTELIGKALSHGPLLTKREKQKGAKAQGSRLAYDDGHVKIVQVGGPGLDPEQAVSAACIYAWETKWCTSRTFDAKKYLSRAPLYIIFRDDIKIAQYQLTKEGRYLDSSLMSIEDTSYKLTSADEDIILALNELGILASTLLSNYVEEELYSGRDLEPGIKELVKHEPRLIYLYCRERFEGNPQRWPEAEPYVAQDPFYGLRYAKKIIKGRFPLFEHYLLDRIKEQPDFDLLWDAAGDYNREIMGGHWVELQKLHDLIKG